MLLKSNTGLAECRNVVGLAVFNLSTTTVSKSQRTALIDMLIVLCDYSAVLKRLYTTLTEGLISDISPYETTRQFTSS